MSAAGPGEAAGDGDMPDGESALLSGIRELAARGDYDTAEVLELVARRILHSGDL